MECDGSENCPDAAEGSISCLYNSLRQIAAGDISEDLLNSLKASHDLPEGSISCLDNCLKKIAEEYSSIGGSDVVNAKAQHSTYKVSFLMFLKSTIWSFAQGVKILSIYVQ